MGNKDITVMDLEKWRNSMDKRVVGILLSIILIICNCMVVMASQTTSSK